jgi:hypothetical protein
VTLLDSLLDAIIRLDGEALVMHVGEKPYVVLSSASINQFRGPLAWGQVELSSRPLTADALLGMLGQILSPEQRHALDDLGAIEEEINAPGESAQRFIVTAARGGDDVWVEVRRRPAATQAPAIVETAEAPVNPIASEPEVPVETLAAPPDSVEVSAAEQTESEVEEWISLAGFDVTETETGTASVVSVSETEASIAADAEVTLAAKEAALAAESDRVLAAKEAALAAEADRILAAKESPLLAHEELIQPG